MLVEFHEKSNAATGLPGASLWINPAHVSAVDATSYGATRIHIQGTAFIVRESQEDVLKRLDVVTDSVEEAHESS